MNYAGKKELLETAKEVARKLETRTDDFAEVQLGWLNDLPLTIMVNHPSSWFGSDEQIYWDENVVFDNIGKFVPVANPYFKLNKLIDKCRK